MSLKIGRIMKSMLNELAIYMHVIRMRFRGQVFASNSCRLSNCPVTGPELEEIVLARLQNPILLLSRNHDAFFGPAILGANALPPLINP